MLESLPEGFVLGTNDTWSLTRHDVRGIVVDSITIDEPRRTIAGADIDAYIDGHIKTLEEAGRDRGFLAGRRRYLEEYEYPTHYPAYSGILSSDDGSIWVERYPLAQESRHWKVFSPEGDLVATVDLPSGFRIMWVGENQVAGVAKNELDVEFVEVRDIQR